MLTWKKKRRHEQTGPALHRIRDTECGQYRAVESVPAQEHAATEHAFYAMRSSWTRATGTTWLIISKHKSEAAARLACEQHERQ